MTPPSSTHPRQEDVSPSLLEILAIADAADGQVRTMGGQYRSLDDGEDITLTMTYGALRAIRHAIITAYPNAPHLLAQKALDDGE